MTQSSNVERIREAFVKNGLSAILIINPINRLYATGFKSSAGMLLITKHDATFYTDSRYIEAAKETVEGAQVLQATDEAPYHELIKKALQQNEIASIGFEDDFITYSEYLSVKEKLNIELVPAKSILNDLRIVKSANDLSKMKEAQRIAEVAFEQALPLITTNMTEKELAAELMYRFLLNGADDKSFNTIAVSGVKTSMPHGTPGDNLITKGFLTIDFGVQVDGWCSDTTRTISIGKPSNEMVKVYQTVLAAQMEGIKAIRAGAAGRDVDAAARAVINEAGYGDFFGHGFGHGLGLEVHEPPRASKSSEDVLQPGTVISAEPGIYLPGRFGVRIEDVVFVTDEGCENITNLTKELLIL